MKPAKRQPDLSIVIPALNEAERIGGTLDKLAAYINSDKQLSKMNVEVLVVAANSVDDTHKIIRNKSDQFKDFKLLKPGSRVGKGRDVQYGMLRAKGEAIIFMDADLATPLKYVKVFLGEYRNGSPVVIAVRNLRKHHPSKMRRFVSSGGNILFRIAGGVWVEDSQCGFKLFSHQAAQLCFKKLLIQGWGFDMEILAIAKTNKMKIRTVKINDWKSVSGGTFEQSPLKNTLKSLLELGQIAARRLQGSYRA